MKYSVKLSHAVHILVLSIYQKAYLFQVTKLQKASIRIQDV